MCVIACINVCVYIYTNTVHNYIQLCILCLCGMFIWCVCIYIYRYIHNYTHIFSWCDTGYDTLYDISHYMLHDIWYDVDMIWDRYKYIYIHIIIYRMMWYLYTCDTSIDYRYLRLCVCGSACTSFRSGQKKVSPSWIVWSLI